MVLRQSKLLLTLCFLLALAGAVIGVTLYFGKQKAVSQNGTKAIPPSFADVIPGPKTTTIEAPNGKMSLIFKEEKTKDGTVDTFSTQADGSTTSIQIYSETLAAGTTLSVPYNTFSPDNKYLFLKRTSTAGVDYFVLKTDGSDLSKDEKSIDFMNLFNQKFSDNHLATDATGWGGMNLIVINTDNPDGSVSHSYWYDVTSNSFIPLSTRFN